MRTITLEEHFATPVFLEGPGLKLKEQAERFGAPGATVLEQLCDLGDKRVAEMDAATIDVQVLSLSSPGMEQVDGLKRWRLLVKRTSVSQMRCEIILPATRGPGLGLAH